MTNDGTTHYEENELPQWDGIDTPKQTDSELREMQNRLNESIAYLLKTERSNGNTDSAVESLLYDIESEIHQREQQIYAELMEEIEEEQSKYTEILDNSFWINQGIASVKTIINNIFKHE